MSDYLTLYRLNKENKIKQFEQQLVQSYEPVEKDILIIVHNQLDWLRKCINSIQSCTKDFHLYIWDNGSDEKTQEYLKTLNVYVHREEENIGFIQPNNYLASISKSPYIILLNSDTEVYSGWDKAMIGLLQSNLNIGQVGYMGSILDKDFRGTKLEWGEDIDFISGWCFCIKRELYERIGLFDENLKFAYGEDSDFSLRVKENGLKIYALYSDLVYHAGNQTIIEILKTKGEDDIRLFVDENYKYLKKRWSKLRLTK